MLTYISLLQIKEMKSFNQVAYSDMFASVRIILKYFYHCYVLLCAGSSPYLPSHTSVVVVNFCFSCYFHLLRNFSHCLLGIDGCMYFRQSLLFDIITDYSSTAKRFNTFRQNI